MSPVHSADLLFTPVEDRNAIKVDVPSKRLYFSIYYYTKDDAFKRASQTKEREIKSRSDWKPARDTFVAIEVRTEADFRAAWARVMKQAKDEGYVVAEGHLFTHASKPKGGRGGLEFAAIPGTGDGTITREEVSQLAKLPWQKTGELILYGCNTGRAGEGRSWTPAQAFADAQGVKTSGTTGYAYFSTSRDKHVKITDDSTEVYLHPYKWGKNGYFGDGEAMPDKIFTPAK
ncbi:hypothetical protein [Ralstonia wenshanensis]|uniref:hypothetical protein n=1 Tax=Ralstonia wenshanensis TaxID=2842456 RepID=UPI0039C6DBB4